MTSATKYSAILQSVNVPWMQFIILGEPVYGLHAFVRIFKLSFVRIMDVGTCQNGLLQNWHLSEWTFAKLALVRMDFCKIGTCQNGLLQNWHLSEWTFAKLAFVRMDFCKIGICQNGLLQNWHLSEWTFAKLAFVRIVTFQKLE